MPNEQCNQEEKQAAIAEQTQNETHVGLTDGKPLFTTGADKKQVAIENRNYRACQYYWVIHPWVVQSDEQNNKCGGNVKTSTRKVCRNTRKVCL